MRHLGSHAAHVYGGLIGILMHVAEQMEIPTSKIGVSALKKHATGNGRATKDMMMRSAELLWPGVHPADDNEADALCLLDWRMRRDCVSVGGPSSEIP